MPLSVIRAEIGPIEKEFTVITDLASSAYFSEDGFSLCALNSIITLIPPELPEWLVHSGSMITIISDSPLNQAATFAFAI